MTFMLYVVKDYREVIKSVKEMQGGYKVAKCMCRSRIEHHLVDRLIELDRSLVEDIPASRHVLTNWRLNMYLAYMKFETVYDKSMNTNWRFAVIGKDSEDIYQNALKYGTEPYFVSSMFELNRNCR